MDPVTCTNLVTRRRSRGILGRGTETFHDVLERCGRPVPLGSSSIGITTCPRCQGNLARGAERWGRKAAIREVLNLRRLVKVAPSLEEQERLVKKINDLKARWGLTF